LTKCGVYRAVRKTIRHYELNLKAGIKLKQKIDPLLLCCLVLSLSGCANVISKEKNRVNIKTEAGQFHTKLVDIYYTCPVNLNGRKFIKEETASMNKLCFYELKKREQNHYQEAEQSKITRLKLNPIEKSQSSLTKEINTNSRPKSTEFNKKGEQTAENVSKKSSISGLIGELLNSTYLINESNQEKEIVRQTKSLNSLKLEQNDRIDFSRGTINAAIDATKTSSKVELARIAIESSQKNVELVNSTLRPQITGSLYAGLENVASPGLGAIGSLNLSKLLYDGGQSRFQKESINSDVSALFEDYRETVNQELFKNLAVLVEMDLAIQLSALGESRVSRLDQLKQKLSVLKTAGAIDATTIAQSNLLVSKLLLRVEELNQQLEIAQQKARNIYGVELNETPMDNFLLNLCEMKIGPKFQPLKAPGLLKEYFYLEKANSELLEVKSGSSYSLGVEAGIQQTIGMSDTQISPSFGLVLRKNLSDGNKLKTEIDLAQRKVFSQEQAIKNQYELLDSQAQELRISIEAFEQKQELNQKNINYTKDEIAFLEKQLTVGQSSLTSIVSAEAQLFELEARSITLKSENYISKLTLLSLLGELDQLIGYKLQPMK